MSNFDDWNNLDQDEDGDDLQDGSFFENKRDVILFCIDCSPSMHNLYEDPVYEDQRTCHLFAALDAAVQIQRKKIVSGPNDHVGILLFNTTLKKDISEGQGSEIKNGTCLFQPIASLSADTIKETIKMLNETAEFRKNNGSLRGVLPPMEQDKRVAMGDVFTSCNWVIRDGFPKSATKRVFLITDNDNPHPGLPQLITSAKTTLTDLTESGVFVEPFFISTEEHPFDLGKFYQEVLAPNSFVDDESLDSTNPSVLPESISITRIDDLLDQMRFREVPKRSIFSLSFELGKEFTIGVKGYGLVTEQKKSSYKYFADQGDEMLLAQSKTKHCTEDANGMVEKNKVVYGIDLGKVVSKDDEEDIDMDVDENEYEHVFSNQRTVKRGQRPYFTVEELREFRTLGLTPGIKLLGFKDRSELRFEDNVKHSLFIYPDETSFNGSKRTFSALIKAMTKKGKIGIARALVRRNATPAFYALLPQEERQDDNGWIDPPGIHLVPLPFDDDLREKPLKESIPASEELVEKASQWIRKLKLKKGGYEPDSYPNPALAFHNAQLEAAAFREPFDGDDFEDLTKPNHDIHHKKAGKLISEWKAALKEDPTAGVIVVNKKSATKRKAATPSTASGFDDTEMREKYDSGTMAKLTVAQLKDYVRSKALPVSGTKGQLLDRIAEYLDNN